MGWLYFENMEADWASFGSRREFSSSNADLEETWSWSEWTWVPNSLFCLVVEDLQEFIMVLSDFFL